MFAKQSQIILVLQYTIYVSIDLWVLWHMDTETGKEKGTEEGEEPKSKGCQRIDSEIKSSGVSLVVGVRRPIRDPCSTKEPIG